jgi:hypothetical protein
MDIRLLAAMVWETRRPSLPPGFCGLLLICLVPPDHAVSNVAVLWGWTMSGVWKGWVEGQRKKS